MSLKGINPPATDISNGQGEIGKVLRRWEVIGWLNMRLLSYYSHITLSKAYPTGSPIFLWFSTIFLSSLMSFWGGKEGAGKIGRSRLVGISWLKLSKGRKAFRTHTDGPCRTKGYHICPPCFIRPLWICFTWNLEHLHLFWNKLISIWITSDKDIF